MRGQIGAHGKSSIFGLKLRNLPQNAIPRRGQMRREIGPSQEIRRKMGLERESETAAGTAPRKMLDL
jgi:hypothetical protein